jgi:rhamnosyltransferase subunit B
LTSDTRPLVALLTFGTGGDLQPFITMAVALNRRGHRTVLVVPRFHEEAVRESGLAYQAFGTREHSLAVLANPDLWNERKGFGVIWQGVLPGLDEVHALLTAFAQRGPCVVLSHPFLLPVAALAREQQPALRLVGAYLSPASLRSLHDPLYVGSLKVPAWMPMVGRRLLWAAVDRFGIDPELLPGLNAARQARGLPLVTRYLKHMQTAGDASVGLFPSWFAPRQPDWPASFVEGDFPLRPLPTAPAESALGADLEAFLRSGPPPIAFTPGTGHRHAAAYFSHALQVSQALGARALFITTHGDQLPPSLPPDVRHLDHAPFDALLPRLALLVHHGGIGTTAEALRAGIPQLVLPFAFDQFDNGARVERLGAGAMLLASQARGRRLQQAVSRLLARPSRPHRAPWPDTHDEAGCLARLTDALERAIGAAQASAAQPA